MRLFVLLLAVKASGLAVRLNKLLPGLSRRKADAAIADGRVTVDGVVADGRTPVERGSEVRLDGETQVWEAREAAKLALRRQQLGWLRRVLHMGAPQLVAWL